MSNYCESRINTLLLCTHNTQLNYLRCALDMCCCRHKLRLSRFWISVPNNPCIETLTRIAPRADAVVGTVFSQPQTWPPVRSVPACNAQPVAAETYGTVLIYCAVAICFVSSFQKLVSWASNTMLLARGAAIEQLLPAVRPAPIRDAAGRRRHSEAVNALLSLGTTHACTSPWFLLNSTATPAPASCVAFHPAHYRSKPWYCPEQ
jgi:hypothetical protein